MVKVAPMKRKKDVHETFSIFFKRYDVPLKMLMGGSKKQTLRSFKK